MAHAHTTWLSDVVNPVPSLALGYGCTLQFAPEVCNHWMVGDSDSGVVAATKPPGWMAIQYVAPGGRESVVLAYRLAKGRAEETFPLRGLVPNALYEFSENGRPMRRASGAELTTHGLHVTLPAAWRAAVIELNCTAHC